MLDEAAPGNWMKRKQRQEKHKDNLRKKEEGGEKRGGKLESDMGEQRLGSKKGQVKNSDEEAKMSAEMGTTRAQMGSEDTGMKDEEGTKRESKNERGWMGRSGSDGRTEIRDNRYRV